MLYEEYERYLVKYRAEYGNNTLVLMQCGSFYELYDDGSKQTDLKTIGELLNIQVSRRNKAILEVSRSNLEMAGFPSYTLHKFINVLVEHNYTVIIVSQVTPPPNPKRQVTDIVSPGVYISDTFLSNGSETTYLMSIFIEDFATLNTTNFYTIGTSLVDLSTGKTFVFESTSRTHDIMYPMDELYRITASFNPREVTICANVKTSTFQENHKVFSFESIVSYLGLHNKCIHNDYDKYSSHLGKLTYQEEILRKVYPNTGLLSGIEFVGLERLPCALISFIRLLQFAYNHNERIISKIQVPTILDETKTLILSYNSLKQLDILPNHNGPQSLCNILNNCKTAVGRRFFKQRLVCPTTCVQTLNNSYDMIDHILNSNCGRLKNLQDCLASIYDIERLFRKIDLGTIIPSELGNLHMSLVSLNNAIEIIETSHENEQTYISDILTTLNESLNIDELPKFNLDNIGPNVFVGGKYSEIDNINNELNASLNILHDLCRSLNVTDTIFKLECNERDGYYLSITSKRYRDFLKDNKKTVIHIKSQSFAVSDFTSKPVSASSSNTKVFHPCFETISDQIELLSTKLKRVVLDKFNKFIEELGAITLNMSQSICQALAEIDFYWCCAYNAQKMCHKRPIIPTENTCNDKSFINIGGLRHPIIESVSKDVKYVSNDVRLGLDNLDGILLYGLNSSGKSSLMKSIGIAVVMAQAGMYVACDHMYFSPYDYIFTRILSNDDIYRGQSTFTKEILELRGIMCRANNKSLVLGDELCSGTESNSALSIVATGVYYLAQRQASFVFATHLHQLVDIDEVKNTSNVKAFHLSVECDMKTKKLIYDRKLKEGNGSTMYGLEVCRSLDMDAEFLETANKIRQKLIHIKRDIVPRFGKGSRYNKDVFIDKCGVCGSQQAIEVHHILQQKDADEKGFIGNIHKNSKFNLVPVCESCHNSIHHGNLTINGYIQTSDGVVLDYTWDKKKTNLNLEAIKKNLLDYLKNYPQSKRKDMIKFLQNMYDNLSTYKIDKLIKEIQSS